jgi:hypothetical protein
MATAFPSSGLRTGLEGPFERLRACFLNRSAAFDRSPHPGRICTWTSSLFNTPFISAGERERACLANLIIGKKREEAVREPGQWATVQENKSGTMTRLHTSKDGSITEKTRTTLFLKKSSLSFQTNTEQRRKADIKTRCQYRRRHRRRRHRCGLRCGRHQRCCTRDRNRLPEPGADLSTHAGA